MHRIQFRPFRREPRRLERPVEESRRGVPASEGANVVSLRALRDRRNELSRLRTLNEVLAQFLDEPTLRVTSMHVARSCRLQLGACQHILDDLVADDTLDLDALGRYSLREL